MVEIITSLEETIPIASSSNGRVSGKSWKMPRPATVRSHLPDGVKFKSFATRMEQNQKALAIKKLQAELRDEREAEATLRRETIRARKNAREEKRRFEEEKAKMGARKAARLKRRAGRSKKVNG
ncbi:hypothetical protein C8J56DRAFT_918681 [Mycena floridula]|nr:hypothetical protein C8J56DRAFT_918681 [Mycena floridula]